MKLKLQGLYNYNTCMQCTVMRICVHVNFMHGCFYVIVLINIILLGGGYLVLDVSLDDLFIKNERQL